MITKIGTKPANLKDNLEFSIINKDVEFEKDQRDNASNLNNIVVNESKKT